MAVGRRFVVAAAVLFSLAISFPGGQSECTESSCRRGMTCCELPEGGEGCCPFRDAVCCSDGVHCCPSGTSCDTARGRCVEADADRKERIQFLEFVSANTSLSNEHCPDGSICPGVTTCCMMTTKHYGCCPYQYGVCCSDKIHCCPQRTYCSGVGTCYVPRGENEVDGPELQEVEQALITAVGCDGQRNCGSDNTCCNRKDGSAACCPMKDAVCCPELDSCCPQGYTCSSFGCIKKKV